MSDTQTQDKTQSIGPETRMGDLIVAYPGARRALFAKYHIGGCQSCAFSPDETVAELCQRNEDLPVTEVLDHVRESHENDVRIMISPEDLEKRLSEDPKPHLVDLRTREEFEAVQLPGAQLYTQELIQEAFANWDREATVVIYDHTGTRSMDGAAYFIGHGFDDVLALEGGIDAYSQRIDRSLPRYRVEIED